MNMHVKALFALFATGIEEHTKGKDSSMCVCRSRGHLGIRI